MKKLNEEGKSHRPESYPGRVETRRNNGNPWHSDETKVKMSESNTGQTRSDETRQRQSEAAIRKFESGWRPPKRIVTQETKNKLSEITKQAWKDGQFTKSGNLFNSKGQQDLTRIISEYIFSENYVDPNKIKFGKSWDIFIEDLKLIIEYNGTYWHYDPRFYEPDHFEDRRNEFAWQIWERDQEKENIATNNGYKFFTIWQYDWELLKTDEEKIEFINSMLSDKIVEYE